MVVDEALFRLAEYDLPVLVDDRVATALASSLEGKLGPSPIVLEELAPCRVGILDPVKGGRRLLSTVAAEGPWSLRVRYGS